LSSTLQIINKTPFNRIHFSSWDLIHFSFWTATVHERRSRFDQLPVGTPHWLLFQKRNPAHVSCESFAFSTVPPADNVAHYCKLQWASSWSTSQSICSNGYMSLVLMVTSPKGHWHFGQRPTDILPPVMRRFNLTWLFLPTWN